MDIINVNCGRNADDSQEGLTPIIQPSALSRHLVVATVYFCNVDWYGPDTRYVSGSDKDLLDRRSCYISPGPADNFASLRLNMSAL